MQHIPFQSHSQCCKLCRSKNIISSISLERFLRRDIFTADTYRSLVLVYGTAKAAWFPPFFMGSIKPMICSKACTTGYQDYQSSFQAHTPSTQRYVHVAQANHKAVTAAYEDGSCNNLGEVVLDSHLAVKLVGLSPAECGRLWRLCGWNLGSGILGACW